MWRGRVHFAGRNGRRRRQIDDEHVVIDQLVVDHLVVHAGDDGRRGR
jgi:hypothetical protein